MNLTISKPILVGDVNILEASEDKLVEIIRECGARIKADADISASSAKFKAKAEELKEIKDKCLKLLDKDMPKSGEVS